jgi:WhiB family transcriptional regulator, redox-sensing transcriptional regulator
MNRSNRNSHKEVTEMSISVLDTYAVSANGVEDEQLPCRRENPELWFAETPQDVEVAKALCLDCPVRAECLAGALERREPWGVWGGQLFLQGVVIPRKRPRGRPRKNAVAA